MAAFCDLFGLGGADGCSLGDDVSIDRAVCAGKGDGVSGFEHAEASEVVDVVVPRDDQIVGRGAAELAAGRHLEPLIVPVGHDRQRQVQRRKIENANILVISDHGHRTREYTARRRTPEFRPSKARASD